MIKIEDFKFDDAYKNEDGTIDIYLIGPKKYLKEKYPEATDTELIFTIKNYEDKEKAIIWDSMISPVHYYEGANSEDGSYVDDDWNDFTDEVQANSITAAQIIELARKAGYKG